MSVKWLAFALLVLVAFSAYGLYRYENTVKILEDELSSLRLRFQSCRLELENLTAHCERLRSEKHEMLTLVEDLKERIKLLEAENRELSEEIEELSFSRTVKYFAVAVEEKSGKGRVIELYATLRPGSGGILVNVTQAMLDVDVQESVKIAAKLAENVTGRSLSNYDVIVTFTAPREIVVEGKSAGAAIALAIIAAVEGKSLRRDVLITGVVSEDGRIGKVGMVVEKARAAKEFGASVFLVPEGQEIRISGLKVVGVSDIWDAMEYVLEGEWRR